jgi:hypothetical protein
MKRTNTSLALAAAVALLLLTNVLTLTNDAFHQSAHEFSKRLFGQTATSSEVRALRAENELLRNENGRLMRSDVALRLGLTTLQLATNHLVLNTTRLVAAHEQVNARSLSQRQVATAIRTKVGMRLLPAVARAVSSIPGKSVPMIGSSVAIAMTALDVRDLCETLKDMDALGEAFGDAAPDESKICGFKASSAFGVRAKWAEFRKRRGGG